MNLHELAALLRRHMLAVVVVLVLAASAGFAMKEGGPTYQESCNIFLDVPPSGENPSPFSSFQDSLVDTADIMARTLMSAPSQNRLHAAGATGAFDVAPVNLYNEEYPDYQSYLTVTASSSDPAETHRTFELVIKAFSGNLAAAQAKQGVPPIDRIKGTVVADSGPVIQAGSPKREYGMFTVVTVIVLLTVTLFLDRHRPVRMRRTHVARHYLRP